MINDDTWWYMSTLVFIIIYLLFIFIYHYIYMIYGIQVDLTMTRCFSFENMEDLTIEHGDLGYENWRIQHEEKLGFKYQINQINHIFLFIFVHSHLAETYSCLWLSLWQDFPAIHVGLYHNYCVVTPVTTENRYTHWLHNHIGLSVPDFHIYFSTWRCMPSGYSPIYNWRISHK